MPRLLGATLRPAIEALPPRSREPPSSCWVCPGGVLPLDDLRGAALVGVRSGEGGSVLRGVGRCSPVGVEAAVPDGCKSGAGDDGAGVGKANPESADSDCSFLRLLIPGGERCDVMLGN